ncbi:hypothetical protein C3941_19880 [Kaistia algarum]|uniref:hypothetical protein n=1 Tax=Kaistia algarum TaxID=2083279 RepID=UPI000CE93633|nr:hypothetical protein [Kaistia algarum]MCX5516253.1 hypothetical protein [Kaistia algarum]PPE78322.1 hypothetical protein C3941_19880 [Kaistia algarum]
MVSAILDVMAMIARAIGIGGCIAIGLLGYYEGVPWIGDIPFIGAIPIVGEIATGRVRTASADAARQATDGLVSGSKLAASEALLARAKQDAAANAALLAAAQGRAFAAASEIKAKLDDLDALSVADTDPALSRWKPVDLDRLPRRPGR